MKLDWEQVAAERAALQDRFCAWLEKEGGVLEAVPMNPLEVSLEVGDRVRYYDDKVPMMQQRVGTLRGVPVYNGSYCIASHPSHEHRIAHIMGGFAAVEHRSLSGVVGCWVSVRELIRVGFDEPVEVEK